MFAPLPPLEGRWHGGSRDGEVSLSLMNEGRKEGFALRGEVLFKRLKSTQKIAGDNAENTSVFSMAFSPDPLFTRDAGGG